MSKFKIGDIVFVSNSKFIAKSDRFILKTGDIAECIGNKPYGYIFLHEHRETGEIGNMFWGEDAHKDLTRYNKRNWCRVFLEMMNEQSKW